MGMTITEKILAAHAGLDAVAPGQSVWCSVDVLLTHDVCGPGTIGIFEKEFGRDAPVFDPERVIIIPDHYIFTADSKAHRNIDILREFVERKGVKHYYDPDFLPAGAEGMPTAYADPTKTSYRGVCHAALAEVGQTRPGELMLGTDSHTCTAGAFGMFATGVGNTDAAFAMGTGKTWLKAPEQMKFTFDGEMPPYLMGKDLILHAIGEIGVDGATYCTMEFDGSTIFALNVDERMTVCNMAIEAGGKNGIIAADEVTCSFVRSRTDVPFTPVTSDPDASYSSTYSFDTTKIEPTVACPHSPAARATAREKSGHKLDRAYIGSCTGGKKTDFLAAAMALAGRSVKIDTFIVPATTEVDHALDTMTVGDKTLREIFTAAGCKIGPASCAACLGGPADTFGRANEPIQVISTTNRNFPGRMGHKQAGIFLASPLTVAASALAGEITDPRDVINFDHAVGLV